MNRLLYYNITRVHAWAAIGRPSRGAIRPSFASISPSSMREGAGKTGCALHPRSRVPSAQKKTHTSIQVQRRHPAFPAQWFTAYFALSPVNGFLATVAPEKLASRELDASTAASGPHDFAVRVRRQRQLAPFASTASHRAFVTWPTPLWWMRCAELWS